MSEHFDGLDRRREPRYAVNLPVTVMRGPARVAGRCLDLSNQGLLVEIDDELEAAEGELMRVEVAEPDAAPIILTVAIARRIERKMGLLLYGVSGDPERVWRALVRRMEMKKAKAGQR
jgi:hypothetical protein